MIRKSGDLEAFLRGGGTVCFQGVFSGNGIVLTANSTGEQVHKRALSVLLRKGICGPVSYDICGDPLEFGILE